MKIEGTHELSAPRERVYALITDPEVLRRCIPGCESLEKTGEDTYAAIIKAGVGMVKGTFKGNVGRGASGRHDRRHRPAHDSGRGQDDGHAILHRARS